MSLSPGTTLGRYEILEPLGAGGMGEVYRAHDPRLGRDVAVKILPEADDTESELFSRFEQEARAIAALSHPNILTVFDVGTHEGVPYLVLELLQGTTLRQRLEDGALSPRETIELATQMMRGIAAAHAVHIVHRDLKPDNLFLTRDGTLKILDFGLAKLTTPTHGTLGEDPTIDLTVPGRLVGTVGYMAPEQLRAESIDERTDLFAVGVIIHEMATGTSPFRRDTAADTSAAILREAPPPLPESMQRTLPGLERVVLRCVEKGPSDRFQSAADLVFALESLGRDEPGRARPEPGLAPPPESGPSIAVLPFADMSVARDQGYFCEGMAEELINALTRIDGLRVAARSSSFQFQGSAVDIQAAGQRLGVTSVLEGSVRKSGDRLRITVQLIDVADGYHRWSERYDRKLEDVFAIQDEIAETVATALRGVLTDEERETLLQRPNTAVETYECFLRGRQLVNEFRNPSMEAAKSMFERTIELDPGYAPAWAGLADTHTWIYQWWGGNDEDLDAADRASRKALELAPNLAEARASRGFAVSLSGRYDEAMRELEEAIRLNPNLFEAYYYYARTCFAAGEIERSAELFRRAAEARPEDYQSMTLLAQSLSMLGRSDDALEANREAVARVERQLELNPSDSRALSLGAHSLFAVEERQRAMEWIERALDLYPEEQGVLINGACLMAKAGEHDRALDLLEFAAEHGWGKADWIAHDPDYDSLRDHPRFQAILRKLG
jgi:TolB-like protein/Tfp pilus assembly protein PilF/tRNA A-37 threonylcarbamoyl transferase component Bud32